MTTQPDNASAINANSTDATNFAWHTYRHVDGQVVVAAEMPIDFRVDAEGHGTFWGAEGDYLCQDHLGVRYGLDAKDFRQLHPDLLGPANPAEDGNVYPDPSLVEEEAAAEAEPVEEPGSDTSEPDAGTTEP